MSESLTRTVGIGAFWNSVGTVGVKLISLGTMFIILRNLSVYEYGLVELVMSIPSLFNIFLLPGLSTVTMVDMGAARSRNDNTEMKRIFIGYVRIVSFFSFLAWVLVLLTPHVFMQRYDQSVQSMVQIVSFQFPFVVLTSAVAILFRVFLKFKWATWNTILYEVSKFAIIGVLFLMIEPAPKYVVFATVTADLCALLIMSPFSIRLYRTFSSAPLLRNESLFAPLKGHGKWGVLSTYLGSISQSVRPWLIKMTIGTEAVGLFAVAQGLIQHTFSLLPLGSLIQPILPQYIERRDLFYKVFHKFFKYQLITSALLALAGLFVFPYVIALLFPKYVASLDLYKLMLIVFVAYAASPIISGTYNALQKQKVLTFALGFRTLLTLVLLPSLALAFGLWGVAAEYIINTTTYQYERFRYLRRFLPELRLSFRELVTFDEYDRMLMEKATARLGLHRQ